MVRTVVVPHGMREAESGKSIMGDWRQSSTASATLVGSTTVQLTELTLGSRLTAAHCGFEGDIVAPEALQFRFELDEVCPGIKVLATDCAEGIAGMDGQGRDKSFRGGTPPGRA